MFAVQNVIFKLIVGIILLLKGKRSSEMYQIFDKCLHLNNIKETYFVYLCYLLDVGGETGDKCIRRVIFCSKHTDAGTVMAVSNLSTVV